MEESSLMNEVKISDDSLQLVVTEKTLGKLTTNARQIRDMVKESLPKYDVSNYNDDNIDQAKKDKAALNKAAKALNDKRIELETEFNKPFEEFKLVVNEAVQLIKQCSCKIDDVVKANDQISRDTKMKEIQTIYRTFGSPVILDKIFDNRWLNKSVTLHKVEEEMTKKISEIKSQVDYLRNLANDDKATFEALKAQYLITLDLNRTLDYFNQLKRQKEQKESEEAMKKEVEATKSIINQDKELDLPIVESEIEENVNITTVDAEVDGKTVRVDTETGEIKSENVNPITNDVNSSTDNVNSGTQEDEILIRNFRVTCTKSKLIALSDYLNDNEIDFDKIEIEETLFRTDRKVISSLLEYASDFIQKASSSTRDEDKARLMINMVKKLNSSLG